MRYLLCFVLFFCFWLPNGLNAQGVGLSGDRFSICYNLAYRGRITPIFDRSLGHYYNELDDEKKSLVKSVFNLRHGLELGFAASRRFSIGAYGIYFRDGAGGYSEQDIQYSLNYRARATGLSFKFFNVKRKGAIAPIGNYFGFKVGWYSLQMQRKPSAVLYGEQPQEELGSYGFPSFSVVFGKHSLLFGKFFLNTDFELNLLFSSRVGYANDVVFIEGETFQRAFSTELFRLSFGFGLVAF